VATGHREGHPHATRAAPGRDVRQPVHAARGTGDEDRGTNQGSPELEAQSLLRRRPVQPAGEGLERRLPVGEGTTSTAWKPSAASTPGERQLVGEVPAGQEGIHRRFQRPAPDEDQPGIGVPPRRRRLPGRAAPVAAPAVARSPSRQGPGRLGERGIGHRGRTPHALEALAEVGHHPPFGLADRRRERRGRPWGVGGEGDEEQRRHVAPA
jgi:hypothetical protein